MKRLFMIVFILSSLLVGCGSRPEASDYLKVFVSGMNEKGVLTFDYDADRLVKDALGLKFDKAEDLSIKNMETYFKFISSIDISTSKKESLKNGDVVEFTISIDDDDYFKKVKTTPYLFTVEGLKEGTVITEQDFRENTVVQFMGISGEGSLIVENIFKEKPLNKISFNIEEHKDLKNGDKIVIKALEDDSLEQAEYVLNDKNGFEVEVYGLDEIAQNAQDIKNLEALSTLIKEKMDSNFSNNYESYKIIESYYRPYATKDALFGRINFDTYTVNPGSFYYLIEHIESYGKEKITYYLYGADRLILDSNGDVTLADHDSLNLEMMDRSYSIQTITKLIESDGFDPVK